MYFAYYSSLLNGKGMVTEYRKALVYSKLVYTIVALVLLFLNFGLISIVVANLMTPFVTRYFSQKFFFTTDLKSKLKGHKASKEEKLQLIEIIWHNAKKLGLVYVGSFTITKMGMFIAGLFLSLDSIASYGLMVQLVSLIAVISTTISTLYQPRLTSMRTGASDRQLLFDFSYTVVIFKILFIMGAILFISFGNSILSWLGSTTALPSLSILILYCIVVFLETNHSLFSSFLVTNNEIPFVKATLVAGTMITIFTFLFLKFTDYGLMSVVLVPLVIQLAYNNWKWPYVVCSSFKINYLQFNFIGIKSLRIQLSKISIKDK